MALGFFIDRASLMADQSGAGRSLALGIGIAFVVLGVLLNMLSIVQYRRGVASLRPIEIPPGYWVNLAVFTSLAVAVLGLLLAVYLAIPLAA
jgi:putative membrane protein